MWYLNRAGLTDQTEYGDGSLVDSVKDPSSLLHNDEKEIFAYMCTSQAPDRCVEGPHGHLRLRR